LRVHIIDVLVTVLNCLLLLLLLLTIKIVHKVQIKKEKNKNIKTYTVKQWTATCSRNSPLHRRCRCRNAWQKMILAPVITHVAQCQHPQQKKTIPGTSSRPRLSISSSNMHIAWQ